MKFTCTQENLKYGLSLVSPVSSKNISLPILNNVLLQVEDSIIRLIATNLEIGVSCVIRGKIEEAGSYTLPAKLMSDYIQLLPKEKVNISLDKNQAQPFLEIQCKNYKTKIKGTPSSDYPLIPKINKKTSYTCDIHDFKKAISQVIFSVSINESRPEICGVLAIFLENSLILAATDSYRLTEKIIPIKGSQKEKTEEQRIIIPARSLYEFSRILHNIKTATDIDDIDDVQISFSENQIVFTVGGIEFTSRLIEGQYPDYKQIIPQKFETSFEGNTEEFIQAIKTTSLFSRGGIFDVILEFLPETKEVVIRSGNSQVGENICKISCAMQGKKNSIVLNYKYILDGLQNIDSHELIMEVIDDANPCIIKPKNVSGYMYIIMPIKQ